MRILKKYINSYLKTSIFILILTTISNILSILYTYFFKNIIDNLIINSHTGVILKWLFIIFGILIVNTILSFLIYDFLLNRLKIEITADLRSSFFKNYLLFPMSKINNLGNGAIKSRILEDTPNISNYVSLYYFILIGNTLRFIYTFFALYKLDILISLIVLITVPLYYLCSRYTFKKISIYSEEERINTDELYNGLEEKMNNIRTIKIYNAEQNISDKFDTELMSWKNSQNKIMIWKALSSLIKDFLTSLLPILIIFISIIRINNNIMTIGSLVAIIGLLDAVYIPIDEIIYFGAMKHSISPVVKRNQEFLNDIDDKTKRQKNYISMNSDNNSVVIKNLNFSYDKSYYLFRNFNLEIDSNGLYLIQGENGSGKTTLFNIISGLQEIETGRLKVSVTNQSSSPIIYMPQENEIFNDNIINNITVYNSSLKKKARVIKNIFPINSSEKLNYNYSGGEERKISIMRMLLKDSNIYLLDEPFENLDINSKKKLINLLRKLSLNSIVMIISHDNYFSNDEVTIIDIDKNNDKLSN